MKPSLKITWIGDTKSKLKNLQKTTNNLINLLKVSHHKKSNPLNWAQISRKLTQRIVNLLLVKSMKHPFMKKLRRHRLRSRRYSSENCTVILRPNLKLVL